MPKFRNKPMVVEAIKFTGPQDLPAIEDFTGGDCKLLPEGRVEVRGYPFPINPDDWIVFEWPEYTKPEDQIRLPNAFDLVPDEIFVLRYSQVAERVVSYVDTSAESSNISGYGYNGPVSTLTVRFKSGGVYRYYGVDEKMFTEFSKAESKGAFFYNRIKDSHKWEKLTDADLPKPA